MTKKQRHHGKQPVHNKDSAAMAICDNICQGLHNGPQAVKMASLEGMVPTST